MTELAKDIRREERIYEARLNIKKFQKCIRNLSRIGNHKGAAHYRTKLYHEQQLLAALTE